jgi:DNA polymerase-3 subunit epsilon
MVDLTLPVDRASVCVLDVETTGLWAEQGHRVCEIAALRVEGGRRVDALDSLVNPCRAIDEDARRVNHISDLDVAGAPCFRELMPRLDALLADTVLVAHNAAFDTSFLVAEYAIAGREVPEVPVLDTLALARCRFGFRRNDLGSVAQSLGVGLGALHRAAGDVETTYQVLLAMAGHLEQRDLPTVGHLLAAQGKVVTLSAPRLAGLPQPLIEAVSSRRTVTICYVDAGGNATERMVDPLWANQTYLIAWCRKQKAQRTFRLDRIVDAWLS